MIYLFFPAGYWLLKSIRINFQSNTTSGITSIVVLGLTAISIISATIIGLFFIFHFKNLNATLFYISILGRVIYKLHKQKYKWVANQIYYLIVAIMFTLPLSFLIDGLLGWFKQYQLVATDALNNLPSGVTMTATHPSTIHVSLWFSVIIILIMNISDLFNEVENTSSKLVRKTFKLTRERVKF